MEKEEEMFEKMDDDFWNTECDFVIEPTPKPIAKSKRKAESVKVPKKKARDERLVAKLNVSKPKPKPISKRAPQKSFPKGAAYVRSEVTSYMSNTRIQSATQRINSYICLKTSNASVRKSVVFYCF